MAIARILAALYLPERPADVVPHCNGIVTAMTGNAYFTTPAPTPALTVVTGHIQLLSAALSAANTRAQGTVEARDTALTVVVSDMHQLKAYVQGISDANRAKAAAIITSAGMGIIIRSPGQKQTFALELGRISGQVHLYAPYVRDATYDWQTSPNQKDWIDLPSTRQASTTVDGLTPLTAHSFRYRTLTREGRNDWSMPQTILVL
jgi:hypothetical protein